MLLRGEGAKEGERGGRRGQKRGEIVILFLLSRGKEGNPLGESK